MTTTEKSVFALGVVGLLLLGATPAAATKVLPKQISCPIGGEKFQYDAILSYSTFGERPDGKPFGTLIFPAPMPECPRNGFVMFRNEFTAGEIARLTPLVATPEYRAMRHEPAYQRAAWLAERIGAPMREQAWLTLRASWTADQDPRRKRALQSRFVRIVDAMAPDATSLVWWALQCRAVNAQRELGEFSGASARIEHLRSLRTTRLAARPDDDQTPAELEGQRTGWLKFLDKQAAVVAKRDRSAEPAIFVSRKR